MHEPVKQRLEDYLHGERVREVEEHLAACGSCREEVAGMRRQSEIFRALQAPPAMEVSPAFYARVMNRIEGQARPSVWSLFGESLFAKRLAYAASAFVVLTGTFFVTLERQQSDDIYASAPEAIFAATEEPVPIDTDRQRGREAVLVTLTTYQGY